MYHQPTWSSKFWNAMNNRYHFVSRGNSNIYIGSSRTPCINVRGRQGRGPSLWEGLWPQRIVGSAVGASGCRWLACLARCLASLPSSHKTVVFLSRILEIPRDSVHHQVPSSRRGASSFRSRTNSLVLVPYFISASFDSALNSTNLIEMNETRSVFFNHMLRRN